MSDDYVNLRGFAATDAAASAMCQIHDWPDEGLAGRLLDAMRAAHGKGGINVCTECLLRARDDARARRCSSP